MTSAAYEIAEWIVLRLPARWAVRLGVGAARVAFALGLPARRTLENNLALLTRGTATRGVARQAFEQFSRSFVEFLKLSRMKPESVLAAVEVRGAEHLAAASASGRGVIVLSAHLGNWEWGAAALAAGGHPVHLVARAHSHPRIERIFERRRHAFGISRVTGRPLWPAAARVLRQRGWIAMMGDRTVPGARRSVCAWAAALARRTGAVIVPALTVRTAEGRYALIVEPALSPDDCAGGGYRDCLRRHLVQHAGQWCAFEPLPEALA
jgi:KDO2-lipid IV(A) lauroyltransferase